MLALACPSHKMPEIYFDCKLIVYVLVPRPFVQVKYNLATFIYTDYRKQHYKGESYMSITCGNTIICLLPILTVHPVYIVSLKMTKSVAI